MTKNYQTSKPMTSAELRHAMPETVSVAMAEIVFTRRSQPNGA